MVVPDGAVLLSIPGTLMMTDMDPTFSVYGAIGSRWVVTIGTAPRAVAAHPPRAIGGALTVAAVHDVTAAVGDRSGSTPSIRGVGEAVGSVDEALTQMAGWLLPGAPDVAPLPTEVGSSFVGLARTWRVAGPVLMAADAGVADLPPAVVQELAEVHLDSMRWCMHVETRLLEVHDWFEAAGVTDWLVIKGPAVAHLDYPDPSLRSFADLDILIAGHDMDRALEVLAENGAVRRIPERRPGFDRRFVKGVGTTCADGVEIDTHRSLAGGPYGFRIPLDRMFAETETFEIGGVTFRALSRRHRALHACYHAVVSSPAPALRTLLDLATYLSADDLTPDVLVSEARRWGGETALIEAVRATLSQVTFDASVWHDWLASAKADPKELATIEKGHHRGRWPTDWETVRELSWRDRAAFLWAVGNPSKAVLGDRHQTRFGRVRAGLGRLVRTPPNR